MSFSKPHPFSPVWEPTPSFCEIWHFADVPWDALGRLASQLAAFGRKNLAASWLPVVPTIQPFSPSENVATRALLFNRGHSVPTRGGVLQVHLAINSAVQLQCSLLVQYSLKCMYQHSRRAATFVVASFIFRNNLWVTSSPNLRKVASQQPLFVVKQSVLANKTFISDNKCLKKNSLHLKKFYNQIQKWMRRMKKRFSSQVQD